MGQAQLKERPRLLFVDDGSSDGTATLLEELCARAPLALSTLSLSPNGGKAEAVRRGLLHAMKERVEVVGYLDADLATPLSELARMLELLSHSSAYAVFGARVALLGHDVNRRGLRHYGGRVFATLAALTLGLEVYDTQCGAKIFRNLPAVAEAFERPFCVDWIFDVEVIARLQQLALRGHLPPVKQGVFELPLLKWTDVSGSKVRPQDALRAIVDLHRLWQRYRVGS